MSFHEKLCTRFDPIIEGNVFLISTYLDPNFGERSFSAKKRKEVRKMIKNKLKSEDTRLSLVEPTPLTESNVNNIDSNYIFYEIESQEVEPVDEYDSLIEKYLDFAKNTKRSTDCLTFWKMYSDQLNDLSNKNHTQSDWV